MDGDARLDRAVLPLVRVLRLGHPARAQLLQGSAGGPRQPRLLPDLGRQPQGGGLLGVQRDGRQPVAVPAGQVTGLAVQVLHRLDDEAEFTQVVLVPLEHAVEGLVVAGLHVGLDGTAQLPLAERPAGPQQTQRQIHQPLGLGNRHRRPSALLRLHIRRTVTRAATRHGRTH